MLRDSKKLSHSDEIKWLVFQIFFMNFSKKLFIKDQFQFNRVEPFFYHSLLLQALNAGINLNPFNRLLPTEIRATIYIDKSRIIKLK